MKAHLSTRVIRRCSAIVTGGSAGGVNALMQILKELPENFPLPILSVQHLHHNDLGALAEHLGRCTALTVIEPCDKEPIRAGCVYVAPANYHMLIEKEGIISLSIDDKINWSRPSIDVMFESASYIWGGYLAGILLSGANSDGTRGLGYIREAGGLSLVQSPESAEIPVMPQSAIDAGVADKILCPKEIAEVLLKLGGVCRNFSSR